MIAGLEEISSGELRIDGKRMNETPPKDRDVAMVFQTTRSIPHEACSRHGLRSQAAEDAKPRSKRAWRHRQAARPRSLSLSPAAASCRAASASAWRWDARWCAGRAFSVRRTAVQSRRQAGTHMRAEIARLHHQLGTTMIYRDPRSDRGHDAGAAHRRAPRAACSRSPTHDALSPPGESLRGRLHRSPAMNFSPVAWRPTRAHRRARRHRAHGRAFAPRSPHTGART